MSQQVRLFMQAGAVALGLAVGVTCTEAFAAEDLPPLFDSSRMTPMRSEGLPSAAMDPASQAVLASMLPGQSYVTRVKVCVDVDDSVAMTPEVSVSSGSSEADTAAVQLAARGRFHAALVDGKPVKSCSILPVRYAKAAAGSPQTPTPNQAQLAEASRKALEDSVTAAALQSATIMDAMLERNLARAEDPDTARRVVAAKKNLYNELLKAGFSKAQALAILTGKGTSTN